MTPESFAEQYREEIEKMAYKIFEMRTHYKQPDTPTDNWERAVAIVKEQHNIKTAHNRVKDDLLRDGGY